MKTKPTRVLVCTVKNCRCGNRAFVVIRWHEGRNTPFHI